MTKEEWAYVACLLDTEGCIHCPSSPAVRLQISQRDPRVLYWVEQNIGGKVYFIRNGGSRNPIYVWQMGKRFEVREVLRQCLPYMKVKPEQAKCAMKLIDTRDAKWSSLLRRLKHHVFV